MNSPKMISIASKDLFTIERCPLEYSCAKSWGELDATGKLNIRFCKECSSEVFMCQSVEEFDAKAEQGLCVAYRILEIGTELIINSPLGLPKRNN
jgi:hypothetical protein